MNSLITSSGQIGPFTSITELADRWVCDGVEYQHSVVGAASVGDWVTPPHVVTTEERAALLKRIDADTDAIYGAVQGNRGPEYQLAEMDATAYKAAGYSGSVPASVQSWATAKGQTATWATDDILTTAAAWRGAQAAIRSNRLARKEAARVATDLAPIAAQWNGFVTYIKTALGIL